MENLENWRPGVLNKDQIIQLCEDDIIKNVDIKSIEDPSSIDLHITDVVSQLKGCVKPQTSSDISSLILSFKEKPLPFNSDGTISLEKKKTYLFQVKESVNFTNTEFYGQATGKSTFGRLDILTRLMTSKNDRYDIVQKNYNGSLWVEITPITFPIKIKKGMSFDQLRVFKGDPYICRIDKQHLKLWGDLIFDENGKKIPSDKTNQINLTLNLNEDPKLKKNICAYTTKEIDDHQELDLTKRIDKAGYINPNDYWEKLKPTIKNPLALEIEPERFYILRSRERFKLPKSVAVYCQAVTENLGELRIHYAGFVHPLFGKGRVDNMGAPLIFEVRGHNIKTFLQHGETLARLEYYFMSIDAEDYDASYKEQELKLSNYFY